MIAFADKLSAINDDVLGMTEVMRRLALDRLGEGKEIPVPWLEWFARCVGRVADETSALLEEAMLRRQDGDGT